MKKIFISNEKIGNLVFLKEAEPKGNKRMGIFICPECNKEYTTQISHAIGKLSTSCGCTRMSKMQQANVTHSLTHCKEYNAWANMLQRCYNKKNPAYKDYGKRGITVCHEWQNSFECFLADMGNCPDDHSIDRIENDKGYYKENCRWATLMVQLMNRRNTKLYSFKGKTQSLNEWAKEYNINPNTLFNRVNYKKMEIESALITPVAKTSRFASF